jgi:predicted Na+-dependent transporter
MTIEHLLVLVLAAACAFVAYAAGYIRGWMKGYGLAADLRTIRVESGAVTVTVAERVIHSYLDQRDMIAVPKGADFQPGRERA